MQHTPEINSEPVYDKVHRLNALLGKLHQSGDLLHMQDIRELVSELRAQEAEILHDLTKDNATLRSILGGPTLAFAMNDDEDFGDE